MLTTFILKSRCRFLLWRLERQERKVLGRVLAARGIPPTTSHTMDLIDLITIIIIAVGVAAIILNA